ncbi:MAG: 50S ribosomal protein L5 [bacterium]|nr:50S ribosomal protein L5 [bacterium]
MDLKTYYKQTVVPELAKELKIANLLAVPKLSKIVINVGVGEALTNKKALDIVAGHLTLITGQKPLITKATRAISGFKLRAGRDIGVKVTLRNKRMYAFFKRLTDIVLPRLRDFRGIDPLAFDKQGNISIGFSEYSLFPEMDNADTADYRGLQVTIVTSTKSDEHARELLVKLGFPFTKEK